MAHDYTRFLLADEELIWQGVVDRTYLALIIILSITLLGGFVWLLYRGWAHQDDQVARFATSPDSVFGGIALIIGLFLVVHMRSLWVKRFVITSKRVLVISGIFGVDVAALTHGQIKSASVTVTLIDSILGIGTLRIDSGKIHTRGSGKHLRTETKYDIFANIRKPYDVYTLLQAEMIK